MLLCYFAYVGNVSSLTNFLGILALINIVLNSDSSTALTTLLRYPSPHPSTPVSFVQDGLYLEQNPTSERGAFIISKYSGKPPESSKTAESTGRLRPGRKFQFRSDFMSNSEGSTPSRSPARNSPLSFEGIFQDVSEGIQRRTETWGVAKAVRGAVNEAKKNMQSIQAEQASRLTRPGDVAPIHGSSSISYRESEATTKLKAQLESLWERNRALAQTLGEAVNDIRSQVTKEETLDADTRSSIKRSLAKIESVRCSLETPNPVLEVTTSSPASGTTSEAKKSENLTVAGEKASISENDKPSRSSVDSTPSNPTPAMSPVGSNGGQRSVLSPKPVQNARPLRQAARPSLANSEFSWMLGGERHLSSFVSPASVPPEQTRQGESRNRNKQNAVFGNGDVEQKPNAEPDGMAMKSLRGAKRAE